MRAPKELLRIDVYRFIKYAMSEKDTYTLYHVEQNYDRIKGCEEHVDSLRGEEGDCKREEDGDMVVG